MGLDERRKNKEERLKNFTPASFILLVILPNSAGPIRNAVKHWGDVKLGTLSVSVNILDL